MNRSFATVPVGWHMSGDVKRFLERGAFDVVHLHGFFPPDIAFWALRHSATVNVVTVHTVGFARSRLAAAIFSRLFTRYNRKLRGRIAVTQGALDFIRPFLPGDYRVIREGVDTRRFTPSLPGIEGLPAESPTILFVGRLDARKGLTVLLEALPLVAKEIPGVRLIVVGRGPMESEARLLATRLGIAEAVDFRGFAPNELLPRYYVSADVFCAPTHGGEAFGIVLLEAMASGIPVVASRITGYEEVVRDGETGILVPPRDPPALARALIKTLTDASLCRRLISNGLEWARYHDWGQVAEVVENYYLELLADDAGSVNTR